MYHNNHIIRGYNFFYNYIFKLFNNIPIDLEEADTETIKRLNLKYSKGLGTVWLLNLKRLYKIFLKYYDEKNYAFIDIGCGNGIPLIYAYKRFNFNSYSGFDFEKRYVENTKINIESSIKKPYTVEVFHQEAQNYLLEESKSFFIFMFNPFDGVIMEKFLKNNIKKLKKNKSVIAYCNYIEIETLKTFCKDIILIEKYKLALIKF